MTTSEKIKKLEHYILTHQGAHYRLAFSYVKNEQNALDIVQDAIVKALKSINRLQEIDYLHTWFYRILMNTAIDFIRKHKKITLVEDFPLAQDKPVNADLHMDLFKALETLTIEQKTLIVLRFFEDMKIQDIARVLDENINTVKARLYTTLKKLRIELEEYDDELK